MTSSYSGAGLASSGSGSSSITGGSSGNGICCCVCVFCVDSDLICVVPIPVFASNSSLIASKSIGNSSGKPKRFLASQAGLCVVYMTRCPPVAFLLSDLLSVMIVVL